LRRSILGTLVVFLLAVSPSCGGGKNRTPEEIPAGAEATSPAQTQADDRPIIVALGDSLTAGLGVEEKGKYPSQLQRLIDSSGHRYRVVNAGVSGDTTAQGLERLGSILFLHPLVVIVELGANDGLRGLPTEQTRANLDEIIRRLRGGEARVILAGMEVPPNYGPDYTEKFRGLYRDLARKYDLPLIPFFLAGVGGVVELNQEDGIHPTAQGYTMVAANVWAELEPTLRQIARRGR